MGKTYDEILQSMLANVSNDVDKREGSIIYDALAPAAAEMAQLYIQLDYLNGITYADEATGEYLSKRCAELGIIRKEATKALRKGRFNVVIPIGTRFALDETTYVVVEAINEFEYKLECEQVGDLGNIYQGTLIPLTSVNGLSEAELTDILIPGEEIETDLELRKRYFEGLNSEAYGGNISDYEVKVKAIQGVGGVKVYPVWNGGGTVKLVILDSHYDPPSPELINQVQTVIDPIQNQGEGLGIAPIGHKVTVEGVRPVTINIGSQITLQEGFAWEDVKGNITKEIKGYFGELRSQWDLQETLVIRISYIETRVLGVPGVLDVQGTTLNNAGQNLILDKDTIPLLGEVNQL